MTTSSASGVGQGGIKLESGANNDLILTYKCKTSDAADAEPEDVKFGVYYKNGEENKWSTINNLVGKPSMNYGLEKINIQ